MSKSKGKAQTPAKTKATSTAKSTAKSTVKSTARIKVKRLPKSKCCVSKDRCKRCPIRMLKEGTLPDGLTVRKRRLVTANGKKVGKKKLAKAA